MVDFIWLKSSIQSQTVYGFDTPLGAVVLSKNSLEVTESAVTFEHFCKWGGDMVQLALAGDVTVGELQDFLNDCGLREFAGRVLIKWSRLIEDPKDIGGFYET